MIHHIEIYVRDLNRTRKFYDLLLPILGYEIFQEFNSGFSYRCDTEYIVFVEVRDKYKANEYNRCNVGLNHIAFKTENPQTVYKINKILKSNSIKMLYNNKYLDSESPTIYFEDPDRIKIEITFDK